MTARQQTPVTHVQCLIKGKLEIVFTICRQMGTSFPVLVTTHIQELSTATILGIKTIPFTHLELSIPTLKIWCSTTNEPHRNTLEVQHTTRPSVISKSSIVLETVQKKKTLFYWTKCPIAPWMTIPKILV